MPRRAAKKPIPMLDHRGLAYVLGAAGGAILPFLTIADASAIRRVGKEFPVIVAEFPWNETVSEVWNMSAWRACFPRAVGLQLKALTQGSGALLDGVTNLVLSLPRSYSHSVLQEAFTHLQGVRSLDMHESWRLFESPRTTPAELRDLLACLHAIRSLNLSHLYVSQSGGMSEAAFVHLRGVHTLNLYKCHQVTDACLAHLAGIHTLDISSCMLVTNTGLSHLRGIHTLIAKYLLSATGDALRYFAGIHTLNIYGWRTCTFSAEQLSHLKGVYSLDIGRNLFEGAALAAVTGVHTLSATNCAHVNDDAAPYFSGVNKLNISICAITDAVCLHLKSLVSLDVSYCVKLTDEFANEEVVGCLEELSINNCRRLTGACFRFMGNLKTLSMKACAGVNFSSAFKQLVSVTVLDVSDCTTLTDADFHSLRPGQLRELDICFCAGLTGALASHLTGIEILRMARCSAMTDIVFSMLAEPERLKTLDISSCPSLTDACLSRLSSLVALRMRWCTQLSDRALVHLCGGGLRDLNIDGCSQLTPACLGGLQYVRNISARYCSGELEMAISKMSPPPLNAVNRDVEAEDEEDDIERGLLPDSEFDEESFEDDEFGDDESGFLGYDLF